MALLVGQSMHLNLCSLDWLEESIEQLGQVLLSCSPGNAGGWAAARERD